MKQKKAAAFAVVAVTLAFVACGDGNVDQYNSRNRYDDASVFPPKIIGLESGTSQSPFALPYIISRNRVQTADGSSVFINIEMTEGELFDRDSPRFTPDSGLFDTNYTGQYQISVYADARHPAVFTLPIESGEKPLNFSGDFPLQFDDYNGDKNPDFTLGQWYDDNGYSYQIFSVYQDRTIKRLPCEELRAATADFSALFTRQEEGSFTCEVYDETLGEKVSRVYYWKDGAFLPRR